MGKKANISVFIPHAGCPHRCSFCDQHSISGTVETPTPLQVKEILAKAVDGLKEDTIAEIAFFGGSFTAIAPQLMEAYLQVASPFVDGEKVVGIRISTRPDAIDREVLSVLKYYGVTAIELGAQSMDDRVLSLNRRRHKAQDVENSACLIREYGFSLGLQMMTGLYGAEEESDRETAQKLLALHPDTVRIYPTLTLKGTYLEELYQRGEYIPPTLPDTVALCAELLCLFESAGVSVIKLGLHAGAENNAVAGPFHPALRELCESEIYFSTAKALLPSLKGEVTLGVNPRCLSKMLGQKRENLHRFARMGYSVTVVADAQVPPHQIKVIPNEKEKSYVPEILGSTGLQVVSR
jgi:histone acetyltransferase (RNA polymerase elongator complex component)